MVVATPAYFERYARPETPRDLEAHVCINYRLVGGGLLPWEFEREGCEVNIRATRQLIVNDGVLATAAVRAGAGLGYLMEHKAADEIADARSKIVEWVADYNGERPHSSLKYQTPAAYAATFTATGDRLRNPTSSADRPLLHPRRKLYKPPRL